MVLPLVKLGTLALKTISKPIASRIKKEAGRHPKFRALIVSIAQSNHRITTNIQRRLYGHSTDVEIRPLNEEKAVQAATDLFGELFVFTVAGIAVIFEVQRSARSEAKKEEQRRNELEEIRERELELERKLEMLDQRVAELQKLANERGLSGIFKFKHGTQASEPSKSAAPS